MISTRRKITEDVMSLDDINKTKLANFAQKNQQKQLIEEKIKKAEEKMTNLLKKGKKGNANEKIMKLTREISGHKDQLDEISNRYEELEYYFLTGKVLEDYYEKKQNTTNLGKLEKIKHIQLLPKQYQAPKPVKKKRKPESQTMKATNISLFFGGRDVVRKKENNYLQRYNNIINRIKKTTPIPNCSRCKKEKTIIPHEGMSTCSYCGLTEFIVIDSEMQSSKEKRAEKQSNLYQRIGNFKEHIAQYQGKKVANIPEEVYEKVKKELKRTGYGNEYSFLAKPSFKIALMKSILKKLKLKNYYKNTVHIICKLSDTDFPAIDQDLKQVLIDMFEEIQEPFEKHKPKERINFLNYSYVFYKLFEILGRNDIKNNFSLLKSVKKLKEQDEIWKKICEELKWKYYPSPISRSKI